MRICIIGKFPPIEGGVSTRTYWTAHGLAARGHEVHVVTNANEVRPPFRMHMRAKDWERCEAKYGQGSVSVHWTDPIDDSQYYIPVASPFVSKLGTIAAQAHSERPFDVIMSYYMEPYGVAGYLAAQMTGLPHVVRMAGSDAGRLWHHPQFEALYDHVLRSAEVVIAAGAVAERAVGRGVLRDRIAFGGGFVVPEDVFTPFGATLDVSTLRSEIEHVPDLRDLLWGDLTPGLPYFGIYGKLGESKGSFVLLAAIERLKRDGLEVGLVALAHGRPPVDRRFRAQARKLCVADRVFQLPFLPHWRVPEFLRGCLAVCCLEQDFPIVFHAPIVAREVLLCGACLIGSMEMIRKLPGYDRLPPGYSCVAIGDVTDTEALSRQLADIVRDPQPAMSLGARGYAFARGLQQHLPFLETVESILEAAAVRRSAPAHTNRSLDDVTSEPDDDRFPLTRLALASVEGIDESYCQPASSTRCAIDIAQACQVLAAVERKIDCGASGLGSIALAVRAEIRIAEAESEADDSSLDDYPQFRLRLRRWALAEGDLAGLVPIRVPRLRIIEFEYDVSQFLGVETMERLPAAPLERSSYVVAFVQSSKQEREPYLVDSVTARILSLSDGTRTAAEVVKELDPNEDTESSLKWIENLFLNDLLWLWDRRIGSVTQATRPGTVLPPDARRRKGLQVGTGPTRRS
jgi:glycosyltransferase involved in cell wall biosynthesis